MRVGLILDNPKRDLTGIAMVAFQLVRQGCEVFIIPLYEQIHDVAYLDLDAIVANYARVNNINYLKACQAMGLTVFVLDTEGGIHPDRGIVSPEFLANRSREVGAYTCVDHYLFWGPRFLQAFLELSGFRKDQLHLTGCPRFDACHEKWRGMLHPRRKGYVLFNLNFPSLNPWWGRAKYHKAERSVTFEHAEREMANALRVTNAEVEKARAHERNRKQAFTAFVHAILNVAERNPGQVFVVRPHPFENQAVYEEIFRETANVVVDNSGEGATAIQGSLFMVHLNCGSSAEARMLGKVPVSLEFLNSDELQVNLTTPSRISVPVKNLDELDRIIKAPDILTRPPFSEAEYKQYLDQWFFDHDGKASERVSQVILTETRQKKRLVRWTDRVGMIKRIYKGQPAKARFVGLIAQVLGTYSLTRALMAVRPARGEKYVSVDTMSAMIQKLACLDREGGRFSVSLARNAFTNTRLATISIVRS